MQVMNIEAKYKGKIDLKNIETNKLPDRLAVFTTVQYIDNLKEIKEYLESKDKTVILPDMNATYNGQILGCSIKKLEGIDGMLYIGDGEFHPIALALENDIPTYKYNPFSKSFTIIKESDIKKIRNIQKAGLAKFYHSKKIGILVSLKPGQFNISIKNKLSKKYPNKKFFTLVFGTLDPRILESFTFIECFVNTACPRISYDDYENFDKKIVHYKSVI
ncbi:MAG: diphthamide synthesis protein [Nanobdellota archaeon]